MRIGVISDSHGDKRSLQAALEAMGEVDAIFHLGDYVDDGLAVQQIKKGIPVYTLRGNCDYGSNAGVEYVKTTIEGKVIIACHGHQYGVKSSINRLYFQAKSEQADVALYGHTHEAFLEEEAGLWIMNPGALSHTWGQSKSYGIINISGDDLSCMIYPLKEK